MATRGITTKTPLRHTFGAGALFRDYDVGSTPSAQAALLIGATEEDSTELSIIQEFVNVGEGLDGSLGKVKSMTHRTKDSAIIKTTVKEITLTELLAKLPGSAATEVGAVATITRADDVDDADFSTNIAWIGDHAYSNGAIGFIIENPLSYEPLVYSPKNKDGGGLALVFEAHYDASDMETAPWSWIWPSSAVVS